LSNSDAKTLDFALGVMIEPVGSTSGQTTYAAINTAANVSLSSGYLIEKLSLPVVISTSLPNGTYKVTLCAKLFGDDQWIPVLAYQTDYNYVTVTKNGTRYTVSNNKTQNITIDDGDVVGELVYNQLSKISLTVSNPSDKDLTKSIYPVLCSGTTPVFKAKGVTLDFEAGETITTEMTCQFELIKGATAPTADTTYKLRFYDPGEYTYAEDPSNLVYYPGFSKDVTMVKGAAPKLVVTSFELPGQPYEIVGSGKNSYIQYTIGEPKPTFACTIRNDGGYYGNVIMVMVYKSDGSNTMPWYGDGVFPVIADLGNGATQNFSAKFDSLDFSDGEYAACLTDSDYNFLKDSKGSDAEFYFDVTLAGVD
ncbi:MAG: hypothetical protein K2H15_05580, partial [Muribaculaceae bacterium]|nr:hypothetical protein [Muribaculaceae bacterium]